MDEKVNIMKAERKQSEFEPVVITIESKDELNYLWHCLDVAKSLIEENCNQAYAFPSNFDKHEMFRSLDKVVRPEKY